MQTFPIDPVKERVCSICGEAHPLTAEFWPKSKESKDGFRQPCKRCKSIRDKEYRERTAERQKERSRAYYEAHKEQHAAYAKAYRESHQEETIERRRKYYAENKEQILAKQHAYRLEHLDREKENHRRYYQEHRKEVLEKCKTYQDAHKAEVVERVNRWRDENREYFNSRLREKKKNDPRYRLMCKARAAVAWSFGRKGYRKNNTAYELTGLCSSDLTDHLLETFRNNYGREWDGVEAVHIDHIIPLATAESIDDVKRLCHYTNLQLLTAEDNLRKRDSLDYEITTPQERM